MKTIGELIEEDSHKLDIPEIDSINDEEIEQTIDSSDTEYEAPQNTIEDLLNEKEEIFEDIEENEEKIVDIDDIDEEEADLFSLIDSMYEEKGEQDMTFMEILPMIIYILLIVLLVILIVLGIKLIFVVDKTDKLLSDVQEKVSSFNGIFKLIDMTGEKISIGVSTIVESIISLINRLFRKRKDNDYE